MVEKKLSRIMKTDLSKGTEEFRDALLGRCLFVLGADDIVELADDELDMLEQRIDYIHRHYPTLKKFAVMRLQNFCCREYLEFSSKFSHLDTDGKIRTNLYHHCCPMKSLFDA